ncbi:MAG: thermonuclease family protein [Hyphomicrobiales bacterium]|nr:thermonuclease family protein [Hyphomicrobiales bacterium]
MVRRRQVWLLLAAALGASGIVAALLFVRPSPGPPTPAARHDGGTGSKLYRFTDRQYLQFSHGPLRTEANRFVPVTPALPVGEGRKIEERLAETVPPAPVVATGEIVAFKPPYEVLDSHSFASGNWAVTLAGVTGPARDAVCFDRDRRLFACGLQARAALNNALRRNELSCRTSRMLNSERLLATCTMREGDLAQMMVRQGWLRSDEPTRADLQDAMQTAESAQLGLWNGGWSIR